MCAFDPLPFSVRLSPTSIGAFLLPGQLRLFPKILGSCRFSNIRLNDSLCISYPLRVKSPSKSDSKASLPNCGKTTFSALLWLHCEYTFHNFGGSSGGSWFVKLGLNLASCGDVENL